MQDRLLNGYLAGTINEDLFNTKSADLKRQAEEVERSLDEADNFDPAQAQAAMAVFDFSQNLVDIWRGSNFAVRREILDCVSSNRTLSPVSLVLTKRKPFDILAKGLVLKKSRGDRTPVELFLGGVRDWVGAGRLVREFDTSWSSFGDKSAEHWITANRNMY